jgi:rhodanese-related sulfurtransferase
MTPVAPRAAQALLEGGGEVAFLDVREAGQFGEGHPLFAVPCPYSVLELRAPELVPRRDVPVLLLDAGDGVAGRAARRLAALGYTDLRPIEGGAPGWAAAGLTLFKGVNVPSKALGELAETLWHPPMVTAETLAAWLSEGRPMAFYDVRPPAEYAKMRVPGAACLPNGEVAHRLARALPAEGPLVITCAGRTRGITGAIGLRAAGFDGPLYALENGTQGWALAGHALDRGNRAEPFPPLDDAALAETAARADRLIARAGLRTATAAEACALLAEPGRTSFLLDVRSAAEAAADPVPAARHALSGQIVQATDQWVGVRGARLILLDDAGLRAAIAGFWLKQLGFEPVVCRLDADPANPLRRLPAPPPPAAPTLDRVEAVPALDALLVDLRPSQVARAAPVPGAVWSIRPRLPDLPVAGRTVLLVAEDPAVAGLAALDLTEAGAARVALAAGAAGVPGAAGGPGEAESIDFLFFVHDRHDGNLEASRRYLEWETGLIAQLSPAERAAFRLIGPGEMGLSPG